jgi:hypothetical protein
MLARSVLRRSLVRFASSLPPPAEPVRLRLPDDGFPLLRRSIPKWFKKEGDTIKSGEPLCEVDTGDVVYDFNSPVAGFLVRITAQEGTTDLKAGEIIAYLAGAEDQINRVRFEAAREIAEHKVVEVSSFVFLPPTDT